MTIEQILEENRWLTETLHKEAMINPGFNDGVKQAQDEKAATTRSSHRLSEEFSDMREVGNVTYMQRRQYDRLQEYFTKLREERNAEQFAKWSAEGQQALI